MANALARGCTAARRPRGTQRGHPSNNKLATLNSKLATLSINLLEWTFQGLSERFHLSRSSDESDLATIKFALVLGRIVGVFFLFAGQDIDAALFQTVLSLEPFLVKAVKADVRINPLLLPPEDDLKRSIYKMEHALPYFYVSALD